MKATLAKSEGYERTLEITVDPDKVKQSYDKALGKAAKQLAVPGFRKGKAPRHLAERQLRPEFLQQNVLEDVGINAYQVALKDMNLEPLSQPRVEWIQFDKEKEMIFRATFDVKPEIEAPDYKGQNVKVPQTEVTDEDVESVLEAEQQKRTTLGPLEAERPLEKGDVATVHFESWENGEEVPGGQAENLLIEVNDEFVMPGFYKHIEGMNRDEERRFTDTFPAEYKNPVLAGKSIEFLFKLLDIKRRIVPELNDDFARQISRYATITELRSEVRRQLEVELHSTIANKAIEQIIPNVKVQLPNSMLVRTSRQILQEWDKQLKSVGSNLEQFVKNQGWSNQQLNTELYPRAQRISIAELIVDAIARQEGITVADNEVETEVDRYAKMSNQDPRVVRDQMENSGDLTSLRDNVLRRKVLEIIYQQTTVEKKEPPAEAEAKSSEGEKEEAPAKETTADEPASTQAEAVASESQA